MATKSLKKKEEVREEIVIGEDTGKKVSVISPALQKKLDEQKEEEKTPEVTMEMQETIIPDKNVKIKVKKTHRCFVGGTWYDFDNTNKTYIVPQNVKDILMKAGVLAPQ